MILRKWIIQKFTPLCTDELKNDFDSISRRKGEGLGWSDDVMDFVDDRITFLFAYEVLQSNKIENDFSFLDIQEENITKNKLKNCLRNQRLLEGLKIF